MNVELGIDDVKSALAEGTRVLLMMRHAERPHIDHEDPTFGESLPITPAGVTAAEALGARLAEYADGVQFFSSPLRRTRLTAHHVAKGMGVGVKWSIDTIPTDGLIGNESFYFVDQMKVWELFRGGEFFRLIFSYIENGFLDGFRPLGEASQMLEDFVVGKFTGRLGIFATHDLYNGAFLKARGAWDKWTVENWVGFLDSAAIFISKDGSRRYALVRNR